MSPETEKKETYHEQLTRIVQALAGGREREVFDELASRAWQSRLTLFADENRDKRINKLCDQVEFVMPVFDDFEKQVLAFVHAVPLAACDSGARDGERFLQWLERTRSLSPEQRDYVACQRARHAVEDAARENRRGHLRFQELLGVAEDLATELETNPTVRIRPNPIRVWCRFETPVLLSGNAAVPADVLFYPVANSIRAAVLEPDAIEGLRPLCRFGSCTIDEWRYEFDRSAGEEAPDRATLISLCREFVANGIVALA
ncbi:MAG: hypothetical protein ACM3U2_23240 [Deltaproteobacteria bacterium]